MSSIYNPYDLCPCGSGLKAKFCCLDGKTWNKKPSLLFENPVTGYSHDKCYANKTIDCVTKISKEHYISEYILNNLGNANTVNISGLPWQTQGEVKSIPKSALVANILCTRHNNLLSPFDTEMGKFHNTINRYDQSFNIEKPIDELAIFCGENLERWMLKTVCAFIVSNQIYVGEKKIECHMKDIYIDILFKDKPFPDGWGMYVDASNDQIIQHHNYIKYNFIVRDNFLQFAQIILNGLVFYLVLDKPENIKSGIIYRPRGIEIKKDGVKKTIEICWQEKKYDQGVFLTHQRNVTRSVDEWNDWVFNNKK